MILIRKSNERGLTQINWLKSFHTFSFGEYYDPKFIGFGNLRVINEDRVQPAQGFGKHGHHDMEIISYVIEGALEHKDSMGTGSIIKPGEIQRMSAGTGVTHSEFNHSKKELVHFLQIWIIPYKSGLAPSYEQKFIPKEKINELLLIGSQEGGDNVITIAQKADLYAGYFTENKEVTHKFKNHSGWLQLVKGELLLNNQLLAAGDGAGIKNEQQIKIKCTKEAEFLLFDLG